VVEEPDKRMKILLAEDNKEISTLYNITLETRGHQVTVTNSGEECLEVYHRELQNVTLNTNLSDHVQPFDAVILDYKMPKINGMQVAKEILAINSHQRIIFASAYVNDTLVELVQELNQPVELLQKPFGQDVLVETMEDKEIYSELQKLNVNIDDIKAANLRHEQLRGILEVLKTTRQESSSQKNKEFGGAFIICQSFGIGMELYKRTIYSIP
jgi:CheY-like chemotaxis protein